MQCMAMPISLEYLKGYCTDAGDTVQYANGQVVPVFTTEDFFRIRIRFRFLAFRLFQNKFKPPDIYPCEPNSDGDMRVHKESPYFASMTILMGRLSQVICLIIVSATAGPPHFGLKL